MRHITLKRWLSCVWNTLRSTPSRKRRVNYRRVRLGLEHLEAREVPSAFTPGDIVVVQIGAGDPTGGAWTGASTTALADTGTAVFLDEYTPSGTFVQQIAMPTTQSGSQAPFVLGNNNSEGLLNLSTDGQDVLLAGYDTTVGGQSGGVDNGTENRVVGVVSSTGAVDTSTVLSAGNGLMGANVREAAGSVANGFYVAGQSKGLAGTFQTSADGGVAYINFGGSTGTDLIGGGANYGSQSLNNGRGVEIFNGQVYLVQNKDTAEPAIMSVNTASSTGLQEPTAATPATTALPLPGTGSNLLIGSNTQPLSSKPKNGEFFLAEVGSSADFDTNGVDSGYNTLYVTDDSVGLAKYTWNSSTSAWISDGTIGSSTTTAYEGLTGSVNGTTVTLYATQVQNSSGAADTADQVVTIVDNTGFGGSITAITPTALTNTTIPAADLGVVYRGIAFVPQGGAAATATTTAAPTVSPTGSQPYGTNETFSAVVTASTGSTAPTAGSVTFMSGSTVLATATTATPSGNMATFSIISTTVPVGTYATNTITAVYSSGAGFTGSTSAATASALTITGTATTTAAPTFTPASAIVGSAISFTAVVTASTGAAAPTAGSVTFMSGSTVLATATSESTSGTHATFTVSTSSLAIGAYSNITAVYAANGAFTTSTSSGAATPLVIYPVSIPAGTIALWTFENDPISGAPPYNNSPAPSVGVGTASGLGMTNSYNSTTSTNSDDVLAGVAGDTGTNGLADLTNIWRIRGSAANGWSSQAPIGTQGAEFATSTVGYSGPINISFDWYATAAGEQNLQLEYTDNGTTWTNVPVTVPTADADMMAKTNSSSPNTVTGSYVQMTGSQWAPNLTATINDPLADNNPNFAIELVNASTGTDDTNTGGTALNNTSGNWRFDNIDIAMPQSYTPGNLVELQGGDGANSYLQGPVSLNEVNPTQNNQVAISGTSADTLGNVTVTTTGTQNFTAGQWVQISGVEVGTTTSTQYDGIYSILTVSNATNTFTYFNQLAANLGAGTPVVVNGANAAWAANVVQQDAIPDTFGTGATGVAAASETGTTVTITTTTTALYAVGESITISGIVSGTGSGASAWDITAPVATVINSTQFIIQAPASLPAITSLTGALATPPNQPLTAELNSPLSVGQLSRSYDGSALTFTGIDSVTDATTTSPTPYSTNSRTLGVVTGNPNIPSDINTATFGLWNGGDDNRTAVAETAYGPFYQIGHNNDVAGFPSYVGVHEFPTEGGPSLGTQVSASLNIRGITIGPDNREYFVTAAGLSSINSSPGLAGVYTDSAALPASGSTAPSADIMVVPNFVTNAKLNGMYIADMNGTGVISNGDRLYYINGDTATGAGGAGLYVATWNTSNDYAWDTPNNAGAAAAGILDYWGVPVRLGDAPIQTGSTSTGTMISVTGTVLSLNNGNTPGTVELYTNAFDVTANDSSIIQRWMDSGSGVTVTSAQVIGSTVTITTASPTNFTNGEWVAVNGIGNGGGATYSPTNAAMTINLVIAGDDGTFQVGNVSNPVGGPYTFTYSDFNSGLVSVSNAGGVVTADAAITSDNSQASTYQAFGIGINNANNGTYNSLAETYGGTIVQTLAGGTDGSINKAAAGIRGIAFATVAPTSVTLANNTGTLTATLTNSQVTPSGQVAFINATTGTLIAYGSISGSAPYTASILASAVVGNAYVEAYFAGGGALALAPAQSNVVQVQNAGATADSVSVSPSLAAVAVNTPVTLTATVTPSSGPTGNVSFYNTTGSVPPSLANLIGTVALTGNTAALTAAFANAGTQTITAVYNGDATYQSSSNTTSVNVAQNATAAITGSVNPAPINTAPSYTVTLTGNATLGTPTGTVSVTIVSATFNTAGHPVINTTSAAITLTAGSGNTATAVWNSSNATPPPTLTVGGSYLVTMSYTPAGGSGYSGFSITPEASGANYTNTALIENVAQAFTPGNLVIVQRGDGSVNTGGFGGLVELDEYTPTGTEVQSIVLPNQPTGSNNPFVSGAQNVALGLINRSANGAYETLIGYDTALGTQFLTSSLPYNMPRTIAEVGSGGASTVNTTTAISTTSPVSVPYEQEDVVSYDGNQFWIVSALPPGDTTESGIEYVSSLGATSATQLTAGGTTAAAISIAGGQLYGVTGGGNVDTVGAGLPTSAAAALTGLPNLQNEYKFYYPTNPSASGVLLLNTTNGTTNNPNVAYVADQDDGLLKFYLNNAAISLTSTGATATATVTSGSLSFLGNGLDQVQITGAPGYNGTYTIPAANITGSGGVGTTFTFTTTGSNLAPASSATAGQWLSGNLGTGVFGQKLLFAGGVNAVTGNVTFNGSGQYTGVQLYVSGSNAQGITPNEFASLTDANAPSAGFPSGNFSLLAVDGASGTNGTGGFNANVNFAGIAFVPGAPTTTIVTSSHASTTYGTNVTFTATITVGTGGVTPTGTVSFYDGTTLLGTYTHTHIHRERERQILTIATVSGSQMASFTTTTPLALGNHTISAVYNPGGQALADDDVSTGTVTQVINYTPGDLVVATVGYSSSMASVSVSGSTVTVTTTNALPFTVGGAGQFATIAGNAGANINGTYGITVTSPTTFTYTSTGAVASGSAGTVSPGSSFSITAVSVSGSTVTVTATGSGFIAGQQVTISGNSGANVNGAFTVISTASGGKFSFTSAGATTGTGGSAAGATALGCSATATFLTDYTGSALNATNTVNLPTAPTPATITGASWSVTNDTVTITTSAADKFQPGQLVTISGVTPSSFNGVFTIASTPTTTTFIYGEISDPGTWVSGGTALVDQQALTEGGTTTTQGYITDSVDGHSLSIGGFDQSSGSSTSSATGDVAVVGPNGKCRSEQPAVARPLAVRL